LTGLSSPATSLESAGNPQPGKAALRYLRFSGQPNVQRLGRLGLRALGSDF